MLACALLMGGAGIGVLVLARDDGGPARPTELPVEATVERVERLRGERFEQPPDVHLAGRREMRVVLKRIETMQSRRERQAERLLLRLTGITRGKPPSPPISGIHESAGDGQVYVRLDIVRGDPKAGELILAHELVHDLQDERFGLGDRLPPLFDDAEQALTAVVEGSAMYTEIAYRRRYHRYASTEEELLRINDRDFVARGRHGPLMVLWNAPYSAGARYAHHVHRRGGWRALRAAERRPPATTAQILHPERSDFRAVSVPPPSGRALGPGWRRLAVADFGELHTIAMLSRNVPIGRARRLAAAWRGGRAVVWRRARGRVAAAIAWNVRDAPAAKRLAQALRAPAVAWRGRTVVAAMARPRNLARELSRDRIGA